MITLIGWACALLLDIVAIYLSVSLKQAEGRAEMYLNWVRQEMDENNELRKRIDEIEGRSGIYDTRGKTENGGRDRKEPLETIFTAPEGS